MIRTTSRTVNFFSFLSNREFRGLSVIYILITAQILSGCYSFTGGTIPPHLKTLSISQAGDNSGFGNPRFREYLTEQIIDRFRKDNSFTLVETGGDAKLTAAISTISDATVTVSTGELERERKVTVTMEAEYFDGIKKKSIWKKTLSNFQIYAIAEGQVGRDAGITKALKQLSDDLLTAVVSGW